MVSQRLLRNQLLQLQRRCRSLYWNDISGSGILQWYGSYPCTTGSKSNDIQGAQCTISTNSNETFTGIFSGLQKAKDSNLQQFYFKMVKSQSHEYMGQGAEHAMAFSTTDIASIEIPEGQNTSRQTNGTSKFRTDADISGNLGQREKNLQKWEAPAGSVAEGGLESGNETSAGWDQFKANERLFGLKTDYDENIYTTTINRNDPQYLQKEREASRLAQEIVASTSTNSHIREERGLDDGGLDEETKLVLRLRIEGEKNLTLPRYSGVTREFESLQATQPGRYVPPSRRSQAATPDELASDPTIISSQIGRPKTDSKQEQVERDIVDTKPEHHDEARKTETQSIPEQTASNKESKAIPQEKPSAAQPSATANVENDLLDSFKHFSALEKIRIQDHKRNKASQDKAVKLNDLKKFSQNFKLCTPVPKDLIPILAKDEAKQKALVEKAQKNAETVKPSERIPSALVDPKSQRPLAAARWENDGPVGDQSKLIGVPTASSRMPKGPQATKPTTGLSARLHESHRNHKAMAGFPPQLPLQSNNTPRGPSGIVSPPKSASMRGPPSATSAKFNVKAMEFKPNPAASTFKPSVSLATTAVDSSRSGSVTRNASPALAPARLFGDKKTFGKPGERKTPLTMSTAKKPDASTSTQNSGFNLPYKAFPTWTAPPVPAGPEGEAEKGETEMKYFQAFDKWRARQPSINTPTQVNPAAHQHQLPFHLQNRAHSQQQTHAPQPIPQQIHGHQHQYSHQPHYDDHHMRPSASNSSQYPAPSPRMHNTNMAYQSPIPPQAQIYGAPVQFVVPGQPHMGGRQYSNGPHPINTVPQGHLAPMMVQQHSQGGYMPQQMAMPYGIIYASPGSGYPPVQHPNGYPSPGRQAPMMMHSGSHQGHQPQYIQPGQYAQPVYSQQPPNHGMSFASGRHGSWTNDSVARGGFVSPQPGFAQQSYQHYPHQHQARRTPSAGYGHPYQMQYVVPQVSQMNGSMEEDGK